MPRPKKKSAIAKKLYAQRCAEAAPLPLKTSEAEVLPLPRKKMADLSGSADKCRRANQQVLLCPAIKRVEAAPLPLKTSEAEVSPLPRKKMADHECLYLWSEPSNLEKSLRFPSVSKVVPSVSKVVPSVSKVVPSVSKMFSEKSLKSSEQSLTSSRKSAERFVVPTKLNENVLNTLNMCVDFPKKSVLKGSFHQADARFGDSRNRQCGAIGLTVVLKSKMKNVLTWTSQDLDSVLVAGTHLYESLINQGNIKDRQVKGRNYIAVHELPRRHVLGNTAFSMEYNPSLTGFVDVNDYSEYDEVISGVAMPLDVALQQALLSADALLVTICANTSAVIKQGSWYAVVHSHAIKTETSCVAYHSSIESLYNYINDMAQLFGEPKPPFEITGVLIHADVSDPLEEASSSFPCSSGKALYSEVLKRTPKVCEPVKTEVRTSDFQVDSGKPWQAQMKYPLKTQSKPMSKPNNTERNIPANFHKNALSASCDFPQKPMLKGSFHQADARFGASRNRQCGAISLTAVLKSKMKDVLTWTAQDLDSVLVAGTHLYESLRNRGNIKDRQVKGRNYIAVHELPRRHVLGNAAFSMEYTSPLTGFVNVNNYSEYDEAISSMAMPLDVALQQALLSADALLLTICANTSALIKQGSWYAVVDSHAIKTETSCVVYHSTIESLYNYINDIAQVFGEPEPPFEITGVLVHAEVSDPLEEASSSSFPCSSGKALYSEVLKRTRKVCEPVKTEVRTSDYRVPVDKVAHTNLPTQTACNVLPSKGKRGRKRKQNELSDKQVIKSHAETVVTDDITITGVLFHADAEVSDPLEEAGSSSFPYSSGKALYNEVLKHTPKVYKSVKTEVRPADYRVPVDEVVNTRSTNLPTQTAGNVLPSKGKRGRKRKQNELSDKRVIKSHHETVVTDDIIITDVSVPDVFFSPLTPNDRQALCGLILLTNVNTDCNVINFGPIADPCQTKTIKPDGNCFFRSLAHVICGSEDKHLKIRRAAVKHLKINTSLFERYVRSEYSSVEDYLTRSRMCYSGTWVTEIDIFVSADLFKTTIMTFNDGRWNAHKPTGEVFTQNVIYLKHCNGNHYEVVTCVKHRDRDGVCAGACGHAVSNEVSKPCLRKRKVSDAAECPATKRHRERYCNDSEYRQKQLKYKKSKYCNDPDFRNANRNCSKDYYASNVQFQKLVRLYSQVKYKSDVVFQGRVREYSKLNYRQNLACKARVGEYSKTKYLQNLAFKATVREYSVMKYHKDVNFRASTIRKGCEIYARKKEQKDIDVAIDYFGQEVNTGPEFVCSVCHRLLFRKQVIECKTECYKDRGEKIAALGRRCITTKYLHVCDEKCNMSSAYSSRCKLWICLTCHRKILGGKLPEESVANNMHLVDVPNQLKRLNSLEQHLIARNIPFMKLLCLPRGKQHGCHGPVVCVPVNTTDVSNILPRNECDDQMIRIKLKRKLTYKGHYEYKYVHTDHVRNALKYLIRFNKCFGDVEINEQWINSLNEPKENVDEKEEQDVVEQIDENDPDEQPEEDLTYIKEQSGLLSDTSLQPVDIGSEVIDQHFQDVLNLAPAEGNSPVSLLSDKSNEAKCFPVLYPTGGPTFHDRREVRITLSRYLNARILNADGRFARSTDFIFYAQYLSELDQVVSNVSIALRKGSDKSLTQLTSDMLTNPDSLSKILSFDEGYKFLRPIRGTPPYWQSTQKDLFALLRQLGIPTFFASFSSADLRWPEIISTILKQEGKNLNANELDWSEKCGLIRRNPVTAARMFDHRWHCFLRDVIMSSAQPIGKIIDYFYRVEFQQRGSPHVHCLFWVENAPKLNEDNEDNDALVASFVDHYITCETPREDETELFETVNGVQKHSVRHSKTCRKKRTVCRFNFPRPPSSRTFITRGGSRDDLKSGDGKDAASTILEKVKRALAHSETTYDSTEDFFESIGINQALFEKAYKQCSKKKMVVLKRSPKDVWVNQYNKHLLRAWQGNMDIQYVTDAYSVVVYIISYITKAEQEMGLLLQRAQNEAMNGNLEARASLKMLGSVYLHNREISAQEAVYRLTGMHLKECSRKVQFIPIGLNPVKMSLPLRVIQNKDGQSGEETNFWMTSLVDRYKNRPNTQEFEIQCLASFCSENRILSKSEVSSQKASEDKVIKLNNNCGYMMKRTRTEPAVVRYPRFSPKKDSEKYFHSLLQLFLPHYEDWQLKPENFTTYEEFYNNGAVKFGGNVTEVKCIVDANRALFEKESDKMDRAQQLLEQGVNLEDAWAALCPETEKERLECVELRKSNVIPNEDDPEFSIPDLVANPQIPYRIESNRAGMSRDEALCLLRSLNAQQSAIFYKVRKWCLEKLLGENPEPFHLFVTGGAGTGKSHLIKAIYYESSRLLSQLSDNPDDRSVILTASTGVASFHIGASTVHNALSIGANVKLPYQPLSDDKINSLRVKMGGLQIMIIDEVSMVDHHLLSYVHGRLRQIKQTGDYSIFGKVSLVCVGDFYQLPPVKGIPLYVDPKGVNLWDSNFEIAELTQVVRQQDASFAEMLNRLRVHKKKESLSPSDVNMLKQRETGEECEAIHIFPTNAQVDEYNVQKLHELCPEAITIRARDFVRNPETGRIEAKVGFHAKVFNSCLDKCVSLGVGARVMLKKNIAVSDGLVNGAFGTVVHISKKQKCDDDEDDFPLAIHVEFDNPNVGKIQRSTQRQIFSPNSTVIEVEEDQVTNDGGLRRQFPLKLAWACTVHKVQGLTVDKAVVSLDKVFCPGQAYVALSRVRTLDGLIINDFKESAIYCNEKIDSAMKIMLRLNLENHSVMKTPDRFTLALHNVQSLRAHVQDIQVHGQLMNADCICLTETWLKVEDDVQIPGFVFKNNPRAKCYDESTPLFTDLKRQRGGGVGVFCCEGIHFNVIIPEPCNLECLYFQVPHISLKAALLYRPNSYPLHMFRQNMLHVIDELGKHSGKKLIMGDFNEDILTSSTIGTLMELHGYSQHVQHPTTEKGTLIDHVYVKDAENVSVEIVQTYYSYHQAVLIQAGREWLWRTEMIITAFSFLFGTLTVQCSFWDSNGYTTGEVYNLRRYVLRLSISKWLK